MNTIRVWMGNLHSPTQERKAGCMQRITQYIPVGGGRSYYGLSFFVLGLVLIGGGVACTIICGLGNPLLLATLTCVTIGALLVMLSMHILAF